MTISGQISLYRWALVLLATFFPAFCGVNSAMAAASPWWETDHGSVRLIAASDAVGNDDALSLGLQFRMKKGWKIYWRSPGDAGFPPRPDWSASRNLSDVSIDWPRPVRFDVLGLTTLGYKDEVVLPLNAKLLAPGQATSFRASMPYLTCNEICVPYEAVLALDLPEGPETTSREAGLIQKFADLVPGKGAVEGLAVSDVRVSGVPGKQTLRVAARVAGGAEPELLVEGPPGFRFAPPALERRGATSVFVASVSPPSKSVRDGKPADLAGRNLVLTLLTPDRAAEQRATVLKGEIAAASGPEPMSVAAFLGILAFAVLGGLILNLMPCVLPVLSLKVLSVVGHGGAEEKGPVRMSFLASAAGILASFAVLATAAVALKSAGHAAGWGIQFQQPLFLGAMAVIVALFAANMFGMFEIRLPGRLADTAATAGQGHGLVNHFATGAFAALLATPCTAPFVGTAVGFALSRGPVEIYAIFIALGLGLALPYLLIAAVPSFATRLPRPGPWMVTLKKILGVALLATAIWLLTVLAVQLGDRAALLAGALLAAIFFVLWVGGTKQGASKRFSGVAVAALALAAVFAPPSIAPKSTGTSVHTVQAFWQPFEPGAIAEHVAAGRTVFVDVTADWCVTCKVNKALVLDSAEIVKHLRSDAIVAMRADWTRPDPVITGFLERFGRYGIPFNVVFGPGIPEGRTLGELLTKGDVMAALDEASGLGSTVTRK